MKQKSEIMLSLTNLNKSYGKQKAVENLSFQIMEGEIFGLLGPNGAGKSTTMECLLGTRKPDSGEIYLLGFRRQKRDKDLFNSIGVQFQNSSFPDQIKVNELSQMVSSLYRDCRDWRSMLYRFGLEKKEKATVLDLSGGEKQLLSLMLALLNKPKLVFLDELTTGLIPRQGKMSGHI